MGIWRKEYAFMLLVRMKIGRPIMENSMDIPQNIKNKEAI